MKKFLIIYLIFATTIFAENVKHNEFKSIQYVKNIRPLLKTYCFKCHDSDNDKGDIDLAKFTDADSIVKHRKTWEKVVMKLNDREMPPAGKNKKNPMPTEKERLLLADWIEYRLQNIDWSKIDYAGHVTIPMLNKKEYSNALSDLLNWKIRLPQEDAIGETGFSSDRDSLYMSDIQLEKYLKLASRILDDYFQVPVTRTHKLEVENFLVTDEWTKPTSWGYAIARRQDSVYSSLKIEQAGIYEINIKAWGYRGAAQLVPNLTFSIDHKKVVSTKVFATQKQPGIYKFLVYLDKGNHLISFNSSKEFTTQAEQKIPFYSYANEWTNDYWSNKYVVLGVDNVILKGPLTSIPKTPEIPETKSEHKNKKSKGKKFKSPTNKMNEIIAGMVKEATKGKKKEERYLTFELKKKILQTLTSAGYSEEDIAANNMMMSNYINSKKPYSPISDRYTGNIWINTLRNTPIQAPPDRSYVLFTEFGDSKYSQRNAALKVITKFATRAFRRPVTTLELSGIMSLYDSEIEKGSNYLEAIKLSLTSVLVSPHFLYRLEQKRMNNEKYRLNNYELASRLSFFLWMSIPDDELRDLAGKGQLSDPEILNAQIDRLLKDPRSKSFTSEFSKQWLGVYKLGKEVQPDIKMFKEFPELLPDMIQEVTLFFDSLVRKNGNALNLIDSNYTYINEKLADFYKIKNVKGSNFRKVSLKNKFRGGVLGMSAVLTASSAHPTRTSPVDRGKWVLEELLGKKLPDPPADVPALAESAGTTKEKMTFRQSLEQHQSDPSCSVCHRKIDPIGFGLQNFDNIGRWRTKIGGKPIDSAGTLPSGESFKNVKELKQLLLKKKEDFSRNLVEKMLSFALGRKIEYYDEPSIRRINQKFISSDYKMQTLIKAVVNSLPFQFQNNQRRMENEK